MGLRNVHVTIPAAVKRGDNALLICNYDMEGDSLYSIKWYKGKREFYRYTPKEEPQSIKTFPVAGINVEVSNDACVKLKHCCIHFFNIVTDESVKCLPGCDFTSRYDNIGEVQLRR